jgi:hypothetical protein
VLRNLFSSDSHHQPDGDGFHCTNFQHGMAPQMVRGHRIGELYRLGNARNANDLAAVGA